MDENEAVDLSTPKYVLLKMADRPAYLIGQLMSESREDVILYYPVLVTIYNDHDGMQIVTSKYLPFAKNELVSIVKFSIHAIATPTPRFIEFYLEFIKRWRDEGLEKILEARIVGDRDPMAQDKALNTELPTEHDTKH